MNPINSFLLFISLFTFNDLSNILLEIQEILPTISDEKNILSQALTFDESTPYFISLEISNEKIKNGEIETETFKVNLGLLNPGITEIKTSKKEMKLILKSSEGDFIQYIKDGEPNGFRDEIEIRLEDIDLARSLEAKFNLAINLAQGDWKKDLNIPADDSALKNWINSRIHNVIENDQTIEQKVEINTKHKDYLKTSSTDGNEKREIHFSIADIEFNKLKIIDGKSSFILELPTKDGEKLVSSIREKEGQKFDNKVKIYFDNASQAKAMALALEGSYGLYEDLYQKRFENYGNCTNCVGRLAELLTTSSIEANYQLTGDCTSKLLQKTEGKDKSYLLEWSDFDLENIKITYQSDHIELTLSTLGKERFITETEDEKITYTDELELHFNDLESARESLQILPKIIGSCDGKVETADPVHIQNHFVEHNPFGEKITQTLTIANNESCTLVFTSIEEDKNKSDEFKFNMYDLNPKGIRANILRDKLILELQTRGKQKIITQTNEKGESKFTDKVEMLFGSVKELRIAKETMLKLAVDCSQE